MKDPDKLWQSMAMSCCN